MNLTSIPFWRHIGIVHKNFLCCKVILQYYFALLNTKIHNSSLAWAKSMDYQIKLLHKKFPLLWSPAGISHVANWFSNLSQLYLWFVDWWLCDTVTLHRLPLKSLIWWMILKMNLEDKTLSHATTTFTAVL